MLMNTRSIGLSGNASLLYPAEFVRRRYDRLAPWYRLFEWILWLPRGIRSRAVRKLELQHGDTVLEVGCGTGRNLPYLKAGVTARWRTTMNFGVYVMRYYYAFGFPPPRYEGSGRGGIRTHGGFPHARFRVECLKPDSATLP